MYRNLFSKQLNVNWTGERLRELSATSKLDTAPVRTLNNEPLFVEGL